jgi:protein-tyrosine sulfotransferase
MAGTPILARVRNRTERLRLHAWRVRPYRSAERHVVVGGAPRSGTTLLRRIFDRHPGLCSGPETKLFIPAGFNLAWLAKAHDIPAEEVARMRRESASQGAFIDAFAARARASSGKARWVEKTPMNIQHLDWIVARFPDVSVVHLIRDGRDVVCSMREHPDWRWVDGRWQKVLVPRPLETYARRWVADTAAGMRWRGDPRYVEVRYEDLVAEPVGELRRICQAIGEPADEAWLAEIAGSAAEGDPEAAPHPDDKGPISGTSIGRWRRDLTEQEQATVARICGPRLAELGYPGT